MHQGEVTAVAFSPDGKTVLTGSRDKTARLWDVSELPDNPQHIATWVEVLTGLELDELGAVKVLDTATWRERREQLGTLGGKPTAAMRWSLDPILCVSDPTARARLGYDETDGTRPRQRSRRPSGHDRSTQRS